MEPVAKPQGSSDAVRLFYGRYPLGLTGTILPATKLLRDSGTCSGEALRHTMDVGTIEPLLLSGEAQGYWVITTEETEENLRFLPGTLENDFAASCGFCRGASFCPLGSGVWDW